jgi:hypothetical protein
VRANGPLTVSCLLEAPSAMLRDGRAQTTASFHAKQTLPRRFSLLRRRLCPPPLTVCGVCCLPLRLFSSSPCSPQRRFSPEHGPLTRLPCATETRPSPRCLPPTGILLLCASLGPSSLPPPHDFRCCNPPPPVIPRSLLSLIPSCFYTFGPPILPFLTNI